MSRTNDDRRSLGLWRAIASGSVRAVAYHITLTYLIPLGAPLITLWLGYLQGYPWMYIWVAMLIAFAAVCTGLLRFDEWYSRRKVESKLNITAPRVARNVIGDGFSLGLQLHNSAHFPIDFEVDTMRTRIGDRVTQTPPVVRSITIPALGFGWWDDGIINVNPTENGALEGYIEFEISYGRAGSSLPCKLGGKKRVVLPFVDGVLQTPVWYEAA